MALAIKPRPDQPDAYDVFTGALRIAAIEPLRASTHAPAAFTWWMVNVSVNGPGRGNEPTLRGAAEAIARVWSVFLEEAHLEPADGQPVRAPYTAALESSPAPARTSTSARAFRPAEEFRIANFRRAR